MKKGELFLKLFQAFNDHPIKAAEIKIMFNILFAH